MSSEFPDRVVHGLRGLDHCHVPCIGNDPRLRLLHGPRQPVSTRYRRRPRRASYRRPLRAAFRTCLLEAQ